MTEYILLSMAAVVFVLALLCASLTEYWYDAKRKNDEYQQILRRIHLRLTRIVETEEELFEGIINREHLKRPNIFTKKELNHIYDTYYVVEDICNILDRH